jgi:hypothetical protein
MNADITTGGVPKKLVNRRRAVWKAPQTVGTACLPTHFEELMAWQRTRISTAPQP